MVDVYADLLFLINGGMDGLCFCLAGKWLHRRLSPLRVMAGAAIGGVYAVLSLFLEWGWFPSLLADLGVCLLMCTVVFGGRSGGGMRGVPAAAAVYFVLSLVMGGVMTGLYNLLNRAGFADLLPAGEEGLTAWLFALLAAVGGGITLLGGRSFRRAAAVRPCRVTVELNGRTAVLNGFVDTGNLLRDPVGGRPVICVRAEALESVLSPALYALMQAGRMDADSLASVAEARRLRVIPAGTATGEGLLLGLLPDHVTVTAEGRGRRGEMTREVDAVIASVTNLTEAEALVPSELLA